VGTGKGLDGRDATLRRVRSPSRLSARDASSTVRQSIGQRESERSATRPQYSVRGSGRETDGDGKGLQVGERGDLQSRTNDTLIPCMRIPQVSPHFLPAFSPAPASHETHVACSPAPVESRFYPRLVPVSTTRAQSSQFRPLDASCFACARYASVCSRIDACKLCITGLLSCRPRVVPVAPPAPAGGPVHGGHAQKVSHKSLESLASAIDAGLSRP
jgi:hypothetical protein